MVTKEDVERLRAAAAEATNVADAAYIAAVAYAAAVADARKVYWKALKEYNEGSK